MNQTVEHPPGPQQQIPAKDGFQYLCELVSEYMKSLPDPVRAPVIQMVNQCVASVGNVLDDQANLHKQLQEARTKYVEAEKALLEAERKLPPPPPKKPGSKVPRVA